MATRANAELHAAELLARGARPMRFDAFTSAARNSDELLPVAIGECLRRLHDRRCNDESSSMGAAERFERFTYRHHGGELGVLFFVEFHG